MRSACSDQARSDRLARQAPLDEIRGRPILLDGYNVLTTVETALGGGVVLVGRDSSYRDMASMHGTFRRVEETIPAAELVGQTLADLGATACTWYLDSPVSNSGRLRAMLLEVSAARGWNWAVEVVMNPDAVLSLSAEIIATADSGILDRCARWLSLARIVVERHVAGAKVVDMSCES